MIENTTKGMSMDEQTKNYIEMLRDEMIDEPVAMTVPTEWVRAVLDALATVTAERDAGRVIEIPRPSLDEIGRIWNESRQDRDVVEGILEWARKNARLSPPSVPGGAG
jgi:hypothetical protein